MTDGPRAVAAPHILSVCLTCDRYLPPPAGEATPGAHLADTLAAHLRRSALDERLTLRRVACLSGCKHSCNVALSGPGKPWLRLHRLQAEHVPAVLTFAHAFVAGAAGDIADMMWPGGLRDHLAACIRPGTS